MIRKAVALCAVAVVLVVGLAGCEEKPKFADPGEVKKANDNRIRAIQENPNLTPAQKEWQINRINGKMQAPKGR